MRRTFFLILMAVLVSTSACNSAKEQGTVSVETSWGKIVQVHQPGDMFSCLSPGCDYYEVDLRDHMDGVDCAGVTTDNIAFYMKVDVVFKPVADRVADYISLFGAENDNGERDSKRWNVLRQHVMNACRNATSGKFTAYDLRAQQGIVLAAMQTELQPKLLSEMLLSLSSIGMEIQPQFNDPRIDEAANMVVAAKKQKEAEDALKAAADVRATRQQVEAQIYSNPNAMKIEELKLMLEIEKVRAQGIASHQGTLILGSTPTQVQIPAGGK
jgi:hypothetical protein